MAENIENLVQKNNLQFKYRLMAHPAFTPEHEITAFADSEQVGRMVWSSENGEISHLNVSEKMRRQGIATSMWDTAHEEAGTRSITPPVHSSTRTQLGDNWAKSVGGHVPTLEDDVDGWTSSQPDTTQKVSRVRSNMVSTQTPEEIFQAESQARANAMFDSDWAAHQAGKKADRLKSLAENPDDLYAKYLDHVGRIKSEGGILSPDSISLRRWFPRCLHK